MNQTSRIISTYSADTFGVCSALFELGGMTVMHDASGCNSTYTTHDEPRWYDMDSMVFISGLSEMEALMGTGKREYIDELVSIGADNAVGDDDTAGKVVFGIIENKRAAAQKDYPPRAGHFIGDCLSRTGIDRYGMIAV